MDETFVEALARAAGLETALRDFRADVIAAATESRANPARIAEVAPIAEPWPPMKPGIGL